MNKEQNKAGKIIFYYGPMYSEKSYHLIVRAEECEDNKICFKPSIDTRQTEGFTLSEIVSRRDDKKIPAYRVKNSFELLKKAKENDTDYIFIDEVQFFDTGLKDAICELRDNGNTVICAGLDLYASRKPWATSDLIMEIADEKIPLTAECRCMIDGKKCQNKAIYTFKFSGDLNKGVDIGDGDKYIAACEECWNREAKKQNK